MKALAVDLGGSHATCALVSEAGVVAAERIALDGTAGLLPALPLLEAALRRVARAAATVPEECVGLGLGFCGLVDSSEGRILSTNGKFDDGPSLDLGRWAADAFSLRFRMENDARLALLGERLAGAARGSDDVVMMTLGTGVGGAAMIGGSLLRGRHFQAGVLGGHLTAAFDGRACSCGSVGCVEAEASTWALPGLARTEPGFETSALATEQRLDFRALFACAAQGDAVALALRERCLRVWASAAVTMIHAWDPDRLVIGGGVMAAGSEVLSFIADHVRRRSWTPWGEVDVRAAELGDQAALVGVLPLLEES